MQAPLASADCRSALFPTRVREAPRRRELLRAPQPTPAARPSRAVGVSRGPFTRMAGKRARRTSPSAARTADSARGGRYDVRWVREELPWRPSVSLQGSQDGAKSGPRGPGGGKAGAAAGFPPPLLVLSQAPPGARPKTAWGRGGTACGASPAQGPAQAPGRLAPGLALAWMSLARARRGCPRHRRAAAAPSYPPNRAHIAVPPYWHLAVWWYGDMRFNESWSFLVYNNPTETKGY